MQNFEDKQHWIGGPTFDVILISEERFDGSSINELLLRSGKFSLYAGSPTEKGMRTIFKLSPNVRLPVTHWHYRSTFRTPYSYYDFSIRPKVFENLVGAQSGEHVVDVNNPTNLEVLINAFAQIIFLIKAHHSIEYATIADETEGRGSSDWRKDLKGLYISKPICDVLQIPSIVIDRSALCLSNSFIDVTRGGSAEITESANANKSELRSIINRHDPAGLLALGAPSDEYNLEIQRLEQLISRYNSVSDVLHLLHEQYSSIYVGEEDLLPRLNNLAEEIWLWHTKT